MGLKDLLKRFFLPPPRPPRPEEREEDAWTPPEVIEIPVSDTLDLHTFSPKDLSGLLPDFLDQAQKAGFFEVRIIHGKGRGVLRKSVHALLSRQANVAEFRLVPENPGATWVKLKKD